MAEAGAPAGGPHRPAVTAGGHERLVQLTNGLLADFNAESQIDDSLPRLLQRLAASLDWRIGFAYSISQNDANTLELKDCYRSDPRYEPLIAASKHPVDNADFPATAARGGYSEWQRPVEASLADERAVVALDLGLRFVTGLLIRSEQGDIYYVLEFFHEEQLDISDAFMNGIDGIMTQLAHLIRRDAARAELARQLDLARQTLDAAIDGSLLVRPNSDIMDASGIGLRLTDGNDESINNKQLASVLSGLPPGLSMTDLAERSIRTRGFDCYSQIPEDQNVPLHASITHADKHDLFIVVLRDLRPIRQAQKLAIQNERLAGIGEMVAALAHESRNALQRMQSCLTLLSIRLSDTDGEIEDLVDDMQLAQDQLHALYEDVRDYAATIELDKRPIVLADLLSTVWDELYLQWRPKNLQWDLKVDAVQDTYSGDKARLKQVLRNILENAIHHSPANETVTCRITNAELDGRPTVRLAIGDAGLGLTREDLNKAFELFFSKSSGGSGMGLTIAKRIVEQHGGKISIQNAARGAEVTIDLWVDG